MARSLIYMMCLSACSLMYVGLLMGLGWDMRNVCWPYVCLRLRVSGIAARISVGGCWISVGYISICMSDVCWISVVVK